MAWSEKSGEVRPSLSTGRVLHILELLLEVRGAVEDSLTGGPKISRFAACRRAWSELGPPNFFNLIYADELALNERDDLTM